MQSKHNLAVNGRGNPFVEVMMAPTPWLHALEVPSNASFHRDHGSGPSSGPGYCNPYEQNVLVREIKFHRLIVLYWLVGQVIRQHTSLDGFLRDVLNIVFSQGHLLTGNSFGQSRFHEDVLDWVHFGDQQSGVCHHVLP